ncbi:MAG: 2-oxoglutarate dehydrogenase E1 component [Rhabdochlamydiaceae bacterium]|nr:2-oxoglutarate dehydrogenase E1 component [Candidatus Amphrikana amoebophyrae]
MSEPFTFIHQHNAAFLDNAYQEFCKDPESVDLSFRNFFEGVQFARQIKAEPVVIDQHYQILNLIRGYRRWGHLEVQCNPLQREKPKPHPYLSLDHYGFSEGDLQKSFPTLGLLSAKTAPFDKILSRLREIYCSSIGLEASSHEFPKELGWLYEQFESRFSNSFSEQDQLKFYTQLVEAEQLEIFINKTYPYITRFSIEGGESFVPMLFELVNFSASLEAEEIVVGMAHRGRLNVLANVMKKPLSEVFFEFDPEYCPKTDVCSDLKYHNGLVSDITAENGKTLKMTLVGNPSHLESVNPVAAGSARARQDLKGSKEKVVPVAIHGDASFAGQGVVYETLQMSRVAGYQVGGTIHFVINNQIGYTASADETRSTQYATEIARAFSCPVFHVNGDDLLACIRTVRLAVEFRQKFGLDVVIDYNCYRRIGHNESDEVSYTHPADYKYIKSKPLISALFHNERAFISDDLQKKAIEAAWTLFKKSHEEVKGLVGRTMNAPVNFDLLMPVSTQVSKEELFTLYDKLKLVPEGFKINPKLKRILDVREKIKEAADDDKLIDWGFGETLALASILVMGNDVRLSGQDSIRGTFSSRHAALIDFDTQEAYYPLKNLSDSQGEFHAYNSILSEYGVLGFDLGYSMVHQKCLTIWEAQYGDFFNGAQIIFDQYISSLYDKWEETSGLTILLPHGLEGKGSEHSSARIERHLQSTANHNMFVCYPSTPVQYFHLLRRQALRDKNVPLIIFTPKSHLRFAPSFSCLSEFTSQGFEEVIDDVNKPLSASRLIFCTGHVYYDLLARREEKGVEKEIAIVRIEQLYPLHKEKIEAILAQYKEAKEIFWVQEEHRNQGACDHMFTFFREELKGKYHVNYVGRAESSVPAAGYPILYKKELEKLLSEAIG